MRADIDDALLSLLPVHHLEDVEGFPFAAFDELVEAVRSGHTSLRARYDSHAFSALANSREAVLHSVLVGVPFLISLASVVLAIAASRYVLLWGVPLSLLGFVLSSPGTVRRMGGLLVLLAAAGAIYNTYRGSWTTSCLFGSFAAANLFTSFGRDQCAYVLQRAATESELALIWLHLRGTVIVQTSVRASATRQR